MKVAIASGKGGTGKTTVATNLAYVLSKNYHQVTYMDCDVEEPNGHLFLRPEFGLKQKVHTPVPEVDESHCTHCGKCAEACEFNAIVVVKQKVLVFPELCHGCGGCTYICPEKAIKETNRTIGVVERGPAGTIDFIHGILNVGESMPPPLIREVKHLINHTGNVIIDASPGTSCPVVEAVKDSDFCLLVTEPTPFGLHDLKLAVGMLKKLCIPYGVIINSVGLGNTEVENYCSSENIPILMTIPWDRRIAEAYSRGIPLILALPEYKGKFLQLYAQIMEMSECDEAAYSS